MIIQAKKDCFICGTRPDIIKMAPLILKIQPFLVHTGQHAELAYDMYKLFDILPDVDLKLMTDNQTVSNFLSKAIIELDKVVKKHKFTRIWVQGDTSSALAGAIVAKFNQISLVHIEAGLRSFDEKNPFPEEIFRKMIDSMANIHFVPTKRAKTNLKNENITQNVHIVGNTVIDAIELIKTALPSIRPIKEKYVLATIHRRESFGKDLEEIFKALKELSKEIKIVLPAHPNPNVRKIIKKIGLKVVQPMNYKDFLWHLKYCEYVVSDSGGVQEEAPTFKKKVIVLRKTTERQELIECEYGILINKMECSYILDKIHQFVKKDVDIRHNPFGDGHASDKIIKIVNNLT